MKLVLVAALVATGCSAEKGGQGGGDAAPNGILRIGLERPQSLDPAQARYPADHIVIDQLFDGLVAYDPETLQVRPALATRWESTPDLKTWTFFLRGNAKFSNGRTITADDVKYTLDRIGKRDSNSPAAAQLESIAGFKALNVDGKADGFEGIVVLSPGAVRMELSYPLSSFAAILGHPALGIVPREAVESDPATFASRPTGSGPFMVRSRSADVLRLMPAPGVTMALKGMEIHMARDGDAPYAAFLRGRLDWTAVPAERVDQVIRDRGREGFRPYPAELMYGFNLRNAKYQDVRFREVIVRAIDRDAIVRVIYGNRVRRTSGVVAEGVPGHLPDPCGEKCQFDPGRSRALLGEVFGSQGVPEVNIDYTDDVIQEAVAQAIQANLRAVGIPANLRPKAYPDYLSFASSGKQELFWMLWPGTYPTPDAFLAPLFYTGAPDNVTGFASPEFDALIRAGREAADETKRLGAYQEAEKLLMSQLPVIPIAQYELHTLVSSRVRDLNMSAFGTFDAARVRLIG